MGTTLTALQAGSASYKFIVAIEGYENLLTDATSAQALAAWAGTDFTGALEGLYVRLENDQAIHPWEPFGKGGRCSLIVVPDSADTFGRDTHRRNAGDETMLTTTADRNDTSIRVKTTTNFGASGDIHVGTECMAYTSTTADTFATLTRGKYSPFGATGSTRFGQHHRAGFTDSSPKLEPLVTQYQRHWQDRWVGVWMHRNVGGALDTKAEAQLVFAGKIVAISDDPETLGTIVELRHVLDVVANGVVGGDIWRAKIQAGVRLFEGWSFYMEDNDGATFRTANALTVVTGAAGANQVEPGFYTHSQLHGILNAWWSSESAAGRLFGEYTITINTNPNTNPRTKIYWRITAAGSPPEVWFNFNMPESVCSFLGYTPEEISGWGAKIGGRGAEATFHHRVAENDPSYGIATNQFLGLSCVVGEERGTFWNNYNYLPSTLKPGNGNSDVADADFQWGVFLIDNKVLVYGAHYTTGTGINELRHVFPAPYMFGGQTLTVEELREYALPAPAELGTAPTVDVQQVYAIEQTEANAWKRFFYSTGTSAYNHATYDVFPHGLGLAIPHDLLGDGNADAPKFCSTVDGLPGANDTIVTLIDKPTKLTDLLGADLVMRWGFVRWKNGHLELGTWKTPTAGNTAATLSELNKAAPSGNKDSHRTPAMESTEWQRSIVKIQYNRDITDAANEDGFRSSWTLQDKVAIDDAGGEGRPATLKLRNTYAQEVATGAGLEALLPTFIANWPMFSRPVIKMSRSIAPTLFEGLSVGDTVLLTDEYARDPDTGLRSTTARPAIITRHWYNPGGRLPNQERAGGMAGGVELLLLATNRTAAYVPCAQVDDTAPTGGYDSLGPTLTCYTHKYSDTTFEDSDVSHFAVGDRVRIIEIDPADPAAPTSWDRIIDSVGTDTITLTVALSAPAWDATKKYRIIFDDYADCQASQQSKAFQADDVDGMIGNATAPRQYTRGWPDYLGNADAVNDPCELPPNAAYGDGVGRDVGHDLALARLAKNFIDLKSAISSPWLNMTVITSSTASVYKLVELSPIYLTEEGLSGSVMRKLSVAPWFRSATGGSVTVRVTLAATPPTGDSFDDVDRGTVYDDASWTTSSSTWQTGSATDLDIGTVKPIDGICWLLVEITQNAEYRGLATCAESARSYA